MPTFARISGKIAEKGAFYRSLGANVEIHNEGVGLRLYLIQRLRRIAAEAAERDAAKQALREQKEAERAVIAKARDARRRASQAEAKKRRYLEDKKK